MITYYTNDYFLNRNGHLCKIIAVLGKSTHQTLYYVHVIDTDEKFNKNFNNYQEHWVIKYLGKLNLKQAKAAQVLYKK